MDKKGLIDTVYEDWLLIHYFLFTNDLTTEQAVKYHNESSHILFIYPIYFLVNLLFNVHVLLNAWPSYINFEKTIWISTKYEDCRLPKSNKNKMVASILWETVEASLRGVIIFCKITKRLKNMHEPNYEESNWRQ